MRTIRVFSISMWHTYFDFSESYVQLACNVQWVLARLGGHQGSRQTKPLEVAPLGRLKLYHVATKYQFYSVGKRIRDY